MSNAMRTGLQGMVTLVLLGVFAGESPAIPAFARKYRTSCQTCHVAFPKLNAFGEAFRRNGYQFPEGTDPQFIKEETVSLGSEGYKRAFPNAVWPNSIPATVPVSLMVESEGLAFPEAEKGQQKISFDNLFAEAEVLAGGTMGEDLTFYGEVELADDVVELERGYLVFDNIAKPRGLSLKIGKFEPSVLSVSNHRRITPAKYLMTTATVGDNAWSLEGTQKGIELSGILGPGRFGYNFGVVEGRKNDPNTAKDIYAHADYKIGGLRRDGVVEGGPEASLGASKPWVDNSVAIGGFTYIGNARLSEGQDDDFTMFGGDVNLSQGNLNLIGAFARQHNDAPLIGSATSVDANHWFVQADYLIYPWLIPTFRYEAIQTTVGEAESETESRFLPVVNFLIRANLRAVFQAEIEKPEGGETEVEELEGSLLFGF